MHQRIACNGPIREGCTHRSSRSFRRGDDSVNQTRQHDLKRGAGFGGQEAASRSLRASRGQVRKPARNSLSRTSRDCCWSSNKPSPQGTPPRKCKRKTRDRTCGPTLALLLPQAEPGRAQSRTSSEWALESDRIPATFPLAAPIRTKAPAHTTTARPRVLRRSAERPGSATSAARGNSRNPP